MVTGYWVLTYFLSLWYGCTQHFAPSGTHVCTTLYSHVSPGYSPEAQGTVSSSAPGEGKVQ